MAGAYDATVISLPFGASSAFGKSTNQYKFVFMTSTGTSGKAVLSYTSKIKGALGVLVNSPTSVEPTAAIQVSGVAQVRMAASTLGAGNLVAASSVGLGITPTSDAQSVGVIVYGSSGSTGRLCSVLLHSVEGSSQQDFTIS